MSRCASSEARKAISLAASSFFCDCEEIESPRPLNIDTGVPMGPAGRGAIPSSMPSMFAKVEIIHEPAVASAAEPACSCDCAGEESPKVPKGGKKPLSTSPKYQSIVAVNRSSSYWKLVPQVSASVNVHPVERAKGDQLVCPV